MEQAGQAKSLTGQVLINDLATALDGHGGIKSIVSNGDYTLTFVLADETEITTEPVRGEKGDKGDRGTDGRAITNVSLTSTNGLVDTYTISFSDGTRTTFDVSNGSDIQSIAKTSTSGLLDTYTVTLTDGSTSKFTVTNGNGIKSIALTSGTHAPGTSDVYKITFDNGEYSTFSVYNGTNGTGAVSTVNELYPDSDGNVTLTGDNLAVSASDSTNVSAALAKIEKNVKDTLAEAETSLDKKIEAAEDTLNASIDEMESNVEAALADVELKKLQFTNTTVAKTAFVADSTYQDYPYRAAVALTGVLASMIPDVVLSLTDATDGNIAPVAECYNGGVYLYAASTPEAAITIPTILCWRGA